MITEKNSLKFTLQVENSDKPNAYRNTIVIGRASVRDTHTNMVRFLEGGLGDDLTALQVQKTERLISFLTHKELKRRAGPIASLDPVLNKHKIIPQAYHSRSFVGNHCHKYLHPSVYRDLTNKIVAQTQACTYDPIIVDEAHSIQLHFNSLNTALSNVHKAISHTKPIEHSYLPNIQSSIDTYMSIYRKAFPQKVIPKQHLLERHCIPYLRQQTFGLGLLGEQGTELSHEATLKLERERAFGIPNELDRLKHILSAVE